jgi:hypothetical protein
VSNTTQLLDIGASMNGAAKPKAQIKKMSATIRSLRSPRAPMQKFSLLHPPELKGKIAQPKKSGIEESKRPTRTGGTCAAEYDL